MEGAAIDEAPGAVNDIDGMVAPNSDIWLACRRCRLAVGELEAYLPAHDSSAVDLTSELTSAQARRWLRAVLVADDIHPCPVCVASAFSVHTIIISSKMCL